MPLNSGDPLAAMIIEQEHTRAERQEHHTDADADARAGGDAGAAFASTANDKVRRHRNQQLKNAADDQSSVKPTAQAFRPF